MYNNFFYEIVSKKNLESLFKQKSVGPSLQNLELIDTSF